MFEWWHWIILGLCLAMAELAVPAFFIVWFGIGALIVGVCLLVWPVGAPTHSTIATQTVTVIRPSVTTMPAPTPEPGPTVTVTSIQPGRTITVTAPGATRTVTLPASTTTLPANTTTTTVTTTVTAPEETP